MHWQMKLQVSPFNQIKSGKKRIEIRLFDEKRQQLKVGDFITFTNFDDVSEKITTEITNLVKFNTFKDLFFEYDPASCGVESRNEYKTMYKYYTEADEQKYGVLAMWIKNSELD